MNYEELETILLNNGFEKISLSRGFGHYQKTIDSSIGLVIMYMLDSEPFEGQPFNRIAYSFIDNVGMQNHRMMIQYSIPMDNCEYDESTNQLKNNGKILPLGSVSTIMELLNE